MASMLKIGRLLFPLILAVLYFPIGYGGVAKAQDDPFHLIFYTPIDAEQNVIEDFGNTFSGSFSKALIDAMQGRRKITIVHIGDSHIQADFFTGKLRDGIQQFNPGMQSSRGMVFPYNLAQSNNPANYQVFSPNQWERTLSTRTLTDGHYGLFGVCIKTTDTLIKIAIRQTDTLLDPFNRLQLWYGTAGSENAFLESNGNKLLLSNASDTLIEINLAQYLQQTDLVIRQQGTFTLFGIGLFNDLPGIEYHNIGINGATAASFNRSQNFGRQLQRLKPDFVFLSLGTNDVYNLTYSDEWFAENLNQLISTILRYADSVPVLITTPNDHARKGENVEARVYGANQVIRSVAASKGVALWDFYKIMGGRGAINQWVTDSLANADKIHLNRKGYAFQANLLYLALIRMFDQWIENNRE